MTEPRYRLRYRFDHGAGCCLWGDDTATTERFGYAVEPENLPLSPATVARIAEVIAWHETSLNWAYPPDPGPWRRAECERFNAVARALHIEIVRELGVIFVVRDEQPPLQEAPDLDAYLDDPPHFRRSL
jgi:hypothetical protein